MTLKFYQMLSANKHQKIVINNHRNRSSIIEKPKIPKPCPTYWDYYYNYFKKYKNEPSPYEDPLPFIPYEDLYRNGNPVCWGERTRPFEFKEDITDNYIREEERADNEQHDHYILLQYTNICLLI